MTRLLPAVLLGLAIAATCTPSDAREPTKRQAGKRVPGSEELAKVRETASYFSVIVGSGSRRSVQQMSQEQLRMLEPRLAVQREQRWLDRSDWLPLTEAAVALYRDTWPDDSTTAEAAMANFKRLYPAFEAAASDLESKLRARGL